MANNRKTIRSSVAPRDSAYNGPMPVLNTDNYSHAQFRKDQKKARNIALEITKLQNEFQNWRDDRDNNEFDTIEEILDKLDELDEESEQHSLDILKRSIKEIPREWLVDGAPEDLDWRESSSYDFIQAKRFNELQNMIMGELGVASGN